MSALSSMAVANGLAHVLRSAGYTPQILSAALGRSMASRPASDNDRAYAKAGTGAIRVAPNSADAAVLVHRLTAGSNLATLARLFLLGSSVSKAEAVTALAPLDLDSLVELGVVTYRSDQVHGAVRISWCDGLLVVCDWSDWEGYPLRYDHVLDVTPVSLVLADLTVRLPGVDALDLATGGGLHALLTSQHAATVVGTDLNSRALAYASLGTALNGTANVVWRKGSLLDPVAGEEFDLITVNPPFVISPETAYLFRDGGEAGDGDVLSRHLVREVAAMLRPQGWASLLCTWVHAPEGDWSAPVRNWLEGLSCDAWILRIVSQDPLAYAAAWSAQSEDGADAFDARLDQWLEYYRNRGIDAIASGAVILHRREGLNTRTWADNMASLPSGAAGEQIQRVFDHQARLYQLTELACLLDKVLAPLEGTCIDQVQCRSSGNYQPAAVKLRLEPGLGVSVPVPPAAVPVVLKLDGERPLRALINSTAASTSFDPADVMTQSLIVARRLISLGLVEWRKDS
jgi:methylase of polypeptide subunit release factors